MATSQKDHVQKLFNQGDGKLLISLARDSIEEYLSNSRLTILTKIANDPRFEIKLGCFVTLKKNDSEKSLRGCIGFPEPVFKLAKALPQAAVAAATEDPRFPPVRHEELGELLTEVSVLTVPRQVQVKSQKDLPKLIEPGRDGLILKWTYGSGLLLPQVAKEYKWDSEEFLSNLSMKAGAPPDQWLVPDSLIYKFHAQVFGERSPNGEVVLED